MITVSDPSEVVFDTMFGHPLESINSIVPTMGDEDDDFDDDLDDDEDDDFDDDDDFFDDDDEDDDLDDEDE